MRSPVRGRRLLAGAAVPLLLATMAACGGSEEPVDQSAERPSASAPSEPSGDQLTTETFLPALKRAVQGNESVHITMDLDAGGQVLNAEGDARFDELDPAMALSMRGAAFGGGQVELRLVDETVYMSLPPLTPPGTFVKVDPQDPNDPLGSKLGDLTKQLDPLQTFSAFDAGLRDVENAGGESISGERLDRYRVKVDFVAASQAQGQPVVPGVPKIVTYDIWVDEENLMRRIELSLGQLVRMEMTASRWGEPVTVQAPPASKIAKRPPQLGGPALG